MTDMRPYGMLAAAALFTAFVALRAGPAVEAGPAANSWFVQDVCVSAPTTDPALCPGAVRDLMPGEALPYSRHDRPYPGHPDGFQRRDCLPLSGGRVGFTFDFGYGSFPGQPYDSQFGTFDPLLDGYDVIEVNGTWASITDTRDGNGLGTFFFGANCALQDGWKLFPSWGPWVGGQTVTTVKASYYERAGEPRPGSCPTSYDRSFTTWEKRFVAYESGRGLVSMVVTHWHTADQSQGYERFYFTTQYGMTRWESAGPTGALLDHREWTLIRPAQNGGWPWPE